MSAPSKYQSDAIHRTIDSTLQTLDSVLLAQALSQDRDLHFPALPSSSTIVVNAIPQSSIEAQASLKRPREAAPLELVPTKESRLTQFNLATESVPVDRLPHQRKIKGTAFFGKSKVPSRNWQLVVSGVCIRNHLHLAWLLRQNQVVLDQICVQE
jgi:hypothetical protein